MQTEVHRRSIRVWLARHRRGRLAYRQAPIARHRYRARPDYGILCAPFCTVFFSMSHKVLLLRGDGIGPEIVAAAVAVLTALRGRYGLDVELEDGLLGGAAIDDCGEPLPATTLAAARAADAILLGAVGGPKWERIACAPSSISSAICARR